MDTLRLTGPNPKVINHKKILPGETVPVNEKLTAQYLDRFPELVRISPTVERSIPVPPKPQEGICVEELDLSKRVQEALVLNDLVTMTDLEQAMAQGDAAMLAMSGIGPRALAELKEAVKNPPRGQGTEEPVGKPVLHDASGEMDAITD